MKSLFGGGAAMAAALLTLSLLFDAPPSEAEPALIQQEANRQQEHEPAPRQKRDSPPSLALPGQAQTSNGKIAAPAGVTAAGPAAVNEVTDAPSAATPAPESPATIVTPAKGSETYVATAYSLSGRTASGMSTSKGIIAADTSVLPLGTRVRLEAGQYSGEYLVGDAGSGVRGRRIDIWVPNNHEACRFGRRNVKLTVLLYGGKRRAKKK